MANKLELYYDLDASAKVVALEAVKHIGSLQQKIVTDIVEIGRTLLRVKEVIGHGNFLSWVDAEFDFTVRSAQNFMRVAERFGSNTKCISHLPLNTVYRLAAPGVPDDLRDRIIARLDGGEVMKQFEIESDIRDSRRVALLERGEAKKSPRTRARAKNLRDRERADRSLAMNKHRENERRESDQRASAADIIVVNLKDVQLDQLLVLMKDDQRISRLDLIQARERAGR